VDLHGSAGIRGKARERGCRRLPRGHDHHSKTRRPGAGESGGGGAVSRIGREQVHHEYLARGFAELGLRFTSPTFPGTGARRSIHCSERRGLCTLIAARIVGARTDRSGSHHTCRTLNGRSHRAAPCAGVSPRGSYRALARADEGGARRVPEKLLFQNPPQILPNTLITAGKFEPQGLAANAADLVAGNTDPTIQFICCLGKRT